MDALIIKLAQFSNLSIVVDSDALLKRETITLIEALRMAYNAVLLAIMSISALLSNSSIKTFHVMADKRKMIGTSNVRIFCNTLARLLLGSELVIVSKHQLSKPLLTVHFLVVVWFREEGLCQRVKRLKVNAGVEPGTDLGLVISK